MTPALSTLADAEDLAVGLRDRAYELMDHHPIAAAHLVLAAASLAPTCEDDLHRRSDGNLPTRAGATNPDSLN